MDLDAIISANFSEEERDTATSGECGTFALALYRALKVRGWTSDLVLVCEADDVGNAYLVADDLVAWRHAAIRFQDQFFDVDGLVEIDDLETNYVWGNSRGSMHYALEERDFYYQITGNQDQTSDMYYKIWYLRLLNLIPQNLSLAA